MTKPKTTGEFRNLNHVMIDIETTGTEPGCCILSVSAVPLYEHAFAFYERISHRKAMEAGFKNSDETLAWWDKQGAVAQTSAFSGTLSTEQVLIELTDWLEQYNTDGKLRVWGNAASFDLKILEWAYRHLGMETPWKYSQECCYRTAKAMFPHVVAEKPLIAHDALEDATAQAKTLEKILCLLK